MGVGSGARELSDLHDETVARLAAAGRSAQTRAYLPHLTVARVKDAHGPLARTAREAAGKAAPRGGVSRVDELTVFRSRPSAAGSVYERLLRIPLRA